MKHLTRSLRNGALSVGDGCVPNAEKGRVVIANRASLISAGTEKMVAEVASKSLLGKARDRPDQVKRVLEKARNEGVLSTFRAVQSRLEEPIALGYSSAGVVIEAGAGVLGFRPGDPVASNGPHAGAVSVPHHLCARAPDGVPFDHSAFTVVGAIAMQGVRLSEATLGETVLVIGLGLVGQLAVGLLRAMGCRVIGTDLDSWKCDVALQMGADVARTGISAEDVESLTGGLGADAVVIAASTDSNAPMDLAAAAVRQKGRVVLVGVVGLELDRRPFYFKEAEFVVSCSYGPGRYDPEYEERGHDYPPAYVRWTEQRNMQAVLDLMARGLLDASPLITHRFAIDDAEKAYELIEKPDERYLGILLEYPEVDASDLPRQIQLGGAGQPGEIGYGVLGAGNFARVTLLPAIAKEAALRPVAICSAKGLSASDVGKKFGFEVAATDEAAVLGRPDVSAVFVLTRHDRHAEQVVKAIEAGKHVFVEKPLCLTEDELVRVEDALATHGESAPVLAVGFNRRFSPGAREVREFFSDVAAPLTVSVRFNAGSIPAEHWVQNAEEGGGRIIGEACHAIDLATYLTGSVPVRVYAESIGGENAPPITDDQCFITLRHANGSVSSVAYLAGGDTAFPKERVEVIGGGRVAVIDDFRTVTKVAKGKTKTTRGRQDKGHAAEIAAFAAAIQGKAPVPMSWDEIRAASLTSILAGQSLRKGMPLDLP